MKNTNNLWTSVSDALPTQAGEYLVTDSDGYVFMCDYSNKLAPGIPQDMAYSNGYAFGEMWSNGLDNLLEVIAWQPVPTAYKGASDD